MLTMYRYQKTSYRSKVHTGYKRCNGKMHGFFTKNDYWFEQQAPQVCQMICGACVKDIDRRPPFSMIMAVPSWDISNKKIDKIIFGLENCPNSWWGTLPRQGRDRMMWLEEIGDPYLPNAKNMQHKVKVLMKLYLDFVTKQNTSMQFWKVGAFRTKPFSKSQYEK